MNIDEVTFFHSKINLKNKNIINNYTQDGVGVKTHFIVCSCCTN